MPQHVAAGLNVLAYQIPPFDTSMVGPDGPSFPPVTYLIIDRDRAVAPGEYIFGQQPGKPAPILRRLRSGFAVLPSAPRYPFTLEALNPLVAPIAVNSADDFAIIGRLIYFMQGV